MLGIYFAHPFWYTIMALSSTEAIGEEDGEGTRDRFKGIAEEESGGAVREKEEETPSQFLTSYLPLQ